MFNSGRLPLTSVKSYGAKGDGVTDDTAALQSCATALGVIAAAGGGRQGMWHPPGTYLVSTNASRYNTFADLINEYYAVQLPAGVVACGPGSGASTILLPYTNVGGGGEPACIGYMNAAANQTNFEVFGLTFDGGARAGANEVEHWGVYAAGACSGIYVHNCVSLGWRGKFFYGLSASYSGGSGSGVNGDVTLADLNVHDHGHGNGIVVTGSSNLAMNRVTINNLLIGAGNAEALILYNIAQLQIDSVTSAGWGIMEPNGNIGTAGTATASTITNCNFASMGGATPAALTMAGGAGEVVTNLLVNNCVFDNSASPTGRGIDWEGAMANVTIQNSTFSGGASPTSGYRNYINVSNDTAGPTLTNNTTSGGGSDYFNWGGPY